MKLRVHLEHECMFVSHNDCVFWNGDGPTTSGLNTIKTRNKLPLLYYYFNDLCGN